MRFVYHQQKVVWKEIVKRVWRCTGFFARERPRVVLNTGAMTDLLKHFQIETGPSVESLRFEQFSFGLKLIELHFKFLANHLDGISDFFFGRDEVLGGVDAYFIEARDDFSADGIDNRDLFDFISPRLNPIGKLFVGWP